MFQIVCCIIMTLIGLPVLVRAEPFNKRLTIYADPGRMECFHQPVAATEIIKIDYQVIAGGHGDRDISFTLMDPKRKILAADDKKDKSNLQLVAEEMGIYKLCFDNTISTFNQKIVSFSLEVAAADYEAQEVRDLRKEMLTDYHFESIFTGLSDYINKVQVNLMRSRQTQDYIRAHEARDRKLAESNYDMVNNWSGVQFLAMIFVGMLQVFMLRSIFSTNGTLHKLWQRF
ncbi:transmembrane emp24 domain-containing protein 5 [Drosophila guanche]|uniref:Blast:Transmembrane emp24 domain-containing protein 5 n=1 Tax=Drosophila guanche TaxID=7266 RepID=A0A3B0K090_DROGU|nr:transmembrane emp24 domain-containing protein 5 [Drosophila guanche]SPP79026.1 blast:Transmembrane emp24 domain-containing protein 5 [Drosophila guanche]